MGQALLGRIRFADGGLPEYDRPYLIVSINEDSLDVLNISSVKGKERKLIFPSNLEIINYNPPFRKPSFVKLDSLVTIEKSVADSMILLDSGKPLNSYEMVKILDALKEFND
ncbi:MAG: hypothetical protein LUG86_00725 [Oscillospiraceae bacterium]|nr:hypothetical protein [Oscillospiraceae bacterium]